MHHNHSHEDHNSTGHNDNHTEDVHSTDDLPIPFPRTSPEQDDSWSDPWITGRDWRVEGIDSEPMTQQQEEAAVTALAALINQWLAKQDTANHPDDTNADASEDNSADNGDNTA